MTLLSEEKLFAEWLLASLSPWEIRPEALFPPSTSLEWQTAFQAVHETSASPKISGDKEGKRRADWHHLGGSENCGLCGKNLTSTAIHLPEFSRQVCFFSKLFYHLPWPVRQYINHYAPGKRFCCPHWSSCKGLWMFYKARHGNGDFSEFLMLSVPFSFGLVPVCPPVLLIEVWVWEEELDGCCP